MELNSKEYNTLKTRNYLKVTELIFFFNGVTKKASEWIKTEQSLKSMNFNYYKVLNKTTKYTLKNSLLNNASPLVNGTTFFIKPIKSKQLSKQALLSKMEPLQFTLLGIKLNNKIYSANIIKLTNLLNYLENKLSFYQFNNTNLKVSKNK